MRCVTQKHAYMAAAKCHCHAMQNGTKLHAQNASQVDLCRPNANLICKPHITQQFAVATSLPLTASRTWEQHTQARQMRSKWRFTVNLA